MEISFTVGLFFVVLSALIGGFIAKKLKFQPIIGYITAGILASIFFPAGKLGIEKLAELGAILLLFSIGLELSIGQFRGLFKKILIIAVIQIIFVTLILFLILKLFNLSDITSLILAIGFSLSSTAVVVKILSDRGESETIHGKLMVGWLLVQDLAVVPVMIILPLLNGNNINELFLPGLLSLGKAVLIIFFAVVLGKNIVPYIVHKVAEINSRELLLLTSVALAVGTAVGASYLGLSPALGAFIAGFVISESQENHAVFAETRPLRDLFVALFFVSLGFLISPHVLAANAFRIISISAVIILVKSGVILCLSYLFKFNGKTMVIVSLGLSQVGEFAFIIFSSAVILKLITPTDSTLGIAIGLITLIVSPFIYNQAVPLWKYLKSKFSLFSSLKKGNILVEDELTDHIVILGYGRVGGWVGRSLTDHNINFVVVDYDQSIVNECIKKGINAIYGDPAEKEVLNAAGIMKAKVVVIAIPDSLSQESVIAHIQTVAPHTKIISRVHLDEDWEKLKLLRVDKLVQPEFEAAVSIIKNIFHSMGKTNEEINKSIKSIRLSHAKI